MFVFCVYRIESFSLWFLKSGSELHSGLPNEYEYYLYRLGSDKTSEPRGGLVSIKNLIVRMPIALGHGSFQ